MTRLSAALEYPTYVLHIYTVQCKSIVTNKHGKKKNSFIFVVLSISVNRKNLKHDLNVILHFKMKSKKIKEHFVIVLRYIRFSVYFSSKFLWIPHLSIMYPPHCKTRSITLALLDHTKRWMWKEILFAKFEFHFTVTKDSVSFGDKQGVNQVHQKRTDKLQGPGRQHGVSNILSRPKIKVLNM